MGQPNVKEQIVAGPLANVSVVFRNKDYIADRVFPILDGSDPKAKITKYQTGAWFRDEAGIRAAGTRARRGGYPLTSVSIATDEYAFAKEVTDEDRRFAKAKNAPAKPQQPPPLPAASQQAGPAGSTPASADDEVANILKKHGIE